MARPNKVGVDYFPLFVVLSEEVKIIEAMYSTEGFGVYIKILQTIYREQGYFYRWGEREQILFSKNNNIDKKIVMGVINECIKWGIFDNEVYDKYGVLTSKEIQNTYLNITYKRVRVSMFIEYILTDTSKSSNVEIISISGNSFNSDIRNPTSTTITDDGNPEVSIFSDNESTQSKIKESKVNQSICSTIEKNEIFEDNQRRLISLCEQNGFKLDSDSKSRLFKLVDKYDRKQVEDAILEAADRGVSTIVYVSGILKNWQETGKVITTFKNNNRGQKAVNNYKNKFHNFEQRSDTYTGEELDDIAKRKRREHSERLKSQGVGEGLLS